MNTTIKDLTDGFIRETITPTRFIIDDLKIDKEIAVIVTDNKNNAIIIACGNLYEMQSQHLTKGNIEYELCSHFDSEKGTYLHNNVYFSLHDIHSVKFHFDKNGNKRLSNYGTYAVIKIKASKLFDK
jgi:hypothetical protein